MKGKIIASLTILALGVILVVVLWNKNQNSVTSNSSISNNKGNVNNEGSDTGSNKNSDEIFISGDDWLNFVAQEKDIYSGKGVVVFGSYEQDGDSGNGKEPIEWIVLDEQDDKLLVISKYCLVYSRYAPIPIYTYTSPDGTSFSSIEGNEPGIGYKYEEEDGVLKWVPYELEEDEETLYTWENSELRQYLNGRFLRTAFTGDEQERILVSELQNSDNPIYGTDGGNTTYDMIFVLSLEEAENYFTTENVKSYLTPSVIMRHKPYSKKELDLLKENGGRYPSESFMLRTPGENAYGVCVLDMKSKSKQSWKNRRISTWELPIRPAMWISTE